MRKALMVAYIFAPTASTGVHRTVKFAKYLPQFHWQPYVLTTANSAYEKTDPTLLENLSAEINVVRSRGFESFHARRLVRRVATCLGARSERILAGLDWRVERLMRPLSIPDAHAPWAMAAVLRGLWTILARRIDLIYSTSWPYSDHVTGLLLHGLTGKPWIADFRDPWLGNANYRRDPHSPLGRIERWIERRYVENASAVVCTADATVQDFRRRYPAVPAAKFHTIFNGFEETAPPPPPPASGPLRLGHVGSFYAARSPRTFFEGLALLARQGLTADDLQVMMVGDMGGHQSMIEPMGLAPFVQCMGPKTVPQCEALVGGLHALCLITAREHAYTIPGKTFEYLASNRPILAMVPPGSDVQAILRRAGGCEMADPDDAPSVASALQKLIARHKAGTLACERDAAYVAQFSRRNQAARLARLMDRLVEPSHETP